MPRLHSVNTRRGICITALPYLWHACWKAGVSFVQRHDCQMKLRDHLFVVEGLMFWLLCYQMKCMLLSVFCQSHCVLMKDGFDLFSNKTDDHKIKN